LAELDQLLAAGDLLPHRLLAIERFAALVDIAELRRLADLDRASVRLLLFGDQAEQRRLAGAVRADHADDAARRQLEGEVLEQEILAIGFRESIGLDDVLAESLGDRNDDLRRLQRLLGRFRDELLVALEARLVLGLAGARRSLNPFALALDRALA